MREPDFRGLRDDAGRAARQPEFDTVQRRAARLRRRRHATGVGTAGAVIAVLGAAGFAVATPPVAAPPADQFGPPAATSTITPTPRNGRPTPPPLPRVRWAAAGDGDHLYVVVADCRDCPPRLMASQDAGRTWQERQTFEGSLRFHPPVTVYGPTTLVVPQSEPVAPTAMPTATSTPKSIREALKARPLPKWRLSTDGGATWKDLSTTGTPVGAAPPDGNIVSDSYDNRPAPDKLHVLDPASGVVAPLANQPPLVRFELANVPVSAGVWVQGYDPRTHQPAVAVSRDRGATWTATVLREEAPAPFDGNFTATMYLPFVATVDGQTVYAMFVAGYGDERVYRSTDGGKTWQRTNKNHRLTTAPFWSPESFVIAGGLHVIEVQPNGEYTLLASRDGRNYTPLVMTGLPKLTRRPIVIDSVHYLYQGDDRLYLSSDGVHWRPTVVP